MIKAMLIIISPSRSLLTLFGLVVVKNYPYSQEMLSQDTSIQSDQRVPRHQNFSQYQRLFLRMWHRSNNNLPGGDRSVQNYVHCALSAVRDGH